jgi:pimeloyl-ACP methyl ester carboxylesterase
MGFRRIAGSALVALTLTTATLMAVTGACEAGVEPFPPEFTTKEFKVGDATLHVRVGGHGPAVLLLHGFGDTGDMWAPLAAKLAKSHTVIVPDLRGMGLSSHPEAGYEKKAQAADIARLLDDLKIDKTAVITHDIGNMVGYAFAAQFPSRVTRWAAMDAPVPGVGPWEEVVRSPNTWHFNFRGPDVERLVAGRERIYLDRFYNELSADPKHIDDATREHYAALYARPLAMHDAFNQFAAFEQDGRDNRELLAKGKLPMPVLAIGGEKSFGTKMEEAMRAVADNVTGIVIANSGHWLMEEQPDATMSALVKFIDEGR